MEAFGGLAYRSHVLQVLVGLEIRNTRSNNNCFISSYFFLQITTVEEAKKFYPLFGLGANVALVFSGRTVKYFSKLRENLGPGVDGWAVSLKAMMSIVVLMGFAICFSYWWLNNNVALPTRSEKKKVISNSVDFMF